MRWSIHLACGALLALAAVSGSAAEREPLSWRDLEGRAHRAALETGRGATVLVFGSTECPCADRYTVRVKELAGGYAGKPVRFYFVFASEGENAVKVRGYAARRGINLPIVLDTGGRLAGEVGAEATPTAVVLDAAGAVRYAGRIDDSADPRLVRRAFVREALDSVLQGAPVRLASTVVVGCAIQGGKPAAEERAARLMPGLGEVRFRPTTRVPQAERFFRQGLALWYGFNFDEAERSFREAARLDPECASAYWGTALSLGMNYNWGFDPAREAEVYQIVRKAVELSKGASERERALIHALSLRHTDQPNPDRQKLLEVYAAEMRRLHQAHPEDGDLAVLYAASAMDLRPWQLWTADGKPQPGTLQVIEALEKVLARDPDHIGAHHLMIHAAEASPTPERALKSAERLAQLAPKSGHLVHMPAHIYQRIGDFRKAAKYNRDAADVDAAYALKDKLPGRYVAYYIHNLDFLAYSHSMGGRAEDALAAARELSEVIATHRPKIGSAVCPSAPLVVADLLVRFQRWEDIRRAAEPEKEDLSGRLFDVYARGMAGVAKGDLEAGERAVKAIDESEPAAAEAFATTTAGTPYAKAGPLLIRTARSVLAAKIALARNDLAGAERHFRAGIEAEDQLPYAEPAMWRSPVREALGGALLRAGKAAEAEAVFREDLMRNRGNGRSLFGLWKSLERQGKTAEAAEAERQFRKAWENADVRLGEGML